MNREQRLARELEGTGLELRVGELAVLPVGTVDLIIDALRASRRAALTEDKARRERRRIERRRLTEDDDQAAGTYRMTRALARRAAANPETLIRLKQHYDDGPAVLALAVAGLRAEGWSWALIGDALGCSRQAAQQRFGVKRELTRNAWRPPRIGGL